MSYRRMEARKVGQREERKEGGNETRKRREEENAH